MQLLLIYSIVLLVAVLISALAERSVLSTSVLFLFAGFLCGKDVLGWIEVDSQGDMLGTLADLALVSILFSDGMKLGLRDLSGAWRLPGRALLFGMPLTFGLTALLAKWLTDLNWIDCLLLGAVLSPTDPVFAAAVVGRTGVPERVRRLLNVESGLNDGLALPAVLVLLKLAGGNGPTGLTIAAELLGGVALGIAIPWAALRLEESKFFRSTPEYRPMNAVAVGLIVFSTAALTGANEFLAVFSAGVTVATRSPQVREAYHRFGELIANALQFAALLVFGAAMSPNIFVSVPLTGYVFVLLVLVAVRPASLAIALFGSKLNWKEWTVAAWFGPKGFASVVYGLLIFKSHIDDASEMVHLIAIVITASIIAHSSTDVLAAEWFHACKNRESGQPA